MEKERKIKILSLVALIEAVLGLTVAFAALSQTLTINGTASVDAAEWDVHFENLTEVYVRGSAEVLSEPVIGNDGKSIKNLQVSLKKPGDVVKYKFDIVNKGTIDAIKDKELINGIDIIKNIPEDEEEIINFGLVLAKKRFDKADFDGDGVTSDEEYLKALETIDYYVDTHMNNPNFSINAGRRITDFDLYVEYKDSSEELPKGEVVLNIDFSWIFVQK